jgi:hypothetical protein
MGKGSHVLSESELNSLPIWELDDRSILVLVMDLLVGNFGVNPEHPLLQKYVAILQETPPGNQSLHAQLGRLPVN